MNFFQANLLFLGLIRISLAASAAEPFLPDHDDLVLVKLPTSSGLHRPIDPDTPPSLTNALPSARKLLRLAREDGDPRLLGRAQAMLQPWWTGPDVPSEALLLRAEIKQGLHAFASALDDLDLALQREPRNAGAWLLKATLHQVLGDYSAARRACLPLVRHGDVLSVTTAAASLRSLTDSSPDIARQLAAVLQQNAGAPTDLLAWSWTTLGEIQARNGDSDSAETSFRTSLGLRPKSPYTTVALADLWLSTGRPNQVIQLLGDATSDLLRLRLAEAWMQMAPEADTTRRLVSDLAASFALTQLRGEELHLREFARFVLRLQKEPDLALSLARRNWALQKEPADLDLFLEAANAAGDHETLAQLEAWATERHLVLRRSSSLQQVSRTSALP
jgi:tetratricopeptide (TPR) repeat protein